MKDGGSYIVQPDGSTKRVEWTEPSDAGPKEAGPKQAPTPPAQAPVKQVKKGG